MVNPVNQLIPLRTVTVGQHLFGPFNLPAGYSNAHFTIDRTVAGGLNGTPAAGVALEFDRSTDGGATFSEIGAQTMVGGPVTQKDPDTGLQVPVATVDFDVRLDGSAEQVQGLVVVSGADVAIAGSIALT